jgi:hypothetical protein
MASISQLCLYGAHFMRITHPIQGAEDILVTMEYTRCALLMSIVGETAPAMNHSATLCNPKA